MLKIESTVSQKGLEVTLLDLGKVVWRQKALFAAITTSTTVAAILVSLVLPKTYSADVSILPTSGSSATSMLAAGLASQLGPAAAMLTGIDDDRSADLVEILNSRSMLERVIARCNLEKEVKGWKVHSDLLKKVQKLTVITPPSMKTKVITVEFRAHSPEVAAKVADTYVFELKSMLDELGYNSAAKNRKFIEDQLRKSKVALKKAEDELAHFQSTTHIASLPDTVVAAIKALGDLEAQRVSAEVELKSTNKALDVVKSKVGTIQADPTMVMDLEVKQKSLSAQEGALSTAKQSFLDKLTDLPPKAMALARLTRDVQVQNAIYLALSQQYESAVITENKESDSFIPLDKAAVPDKPSSPKLLINAIIGFVVGMFLGALTVFARHGLSKSVA